MAYTERTVTTQAELDQALAEKVDYIAIRSDPGVWLKIIHSESSRVVAWGSSSVEAWGSSRVVARGSSRVVARGSSSVEARGSSSVVAWEASSVEAWEASSVEAREASSVEARGSSRVVASKCVAVHLHSAKVDVKGGVIIDLTKLDLTDPTAWCEYHGVKVQRGIATLYKAVNDQWTTFHGTDYSPGVKPSCSDFVSDNQCGGGLHVCPSPAQSLDYYPEATRFVAIGVRVSELCPITDGGTAKAKFAKAARACVEVDRFGDPVGAVA